eukprot:Colp12_sorted_trinity150504_noHs@23189
METFKELLSKSSLKISRPSAKILNRIVQLYSTVAILVSTPGQALELYKRASRSLGSTTKAAVKESFLVDDPLTTVEGARSILQCAFRLPSLEPVVFKLSDTKEPALAEFEVWKAVVGAGKPRGHCIIYNMEMIDVGPRVALVLPLYPNTASSLTNLRSDLVARFVDRVYEAAKIMHSCNYVHADIKLSNVLIDFEGNFVLADLGSAVKIGEQVKEYSHFYTIPGMEGNQCAAKVMDYYAIIVCALVLLGELDAHQVDRPLYQTVKIGCATWASKIPALQELSQLVEEGYGERLAALP